MLFLQRNIRVSLLGSSVDLGRRILRSLAQRPISARALKMMASEVKRTKGLSNEIDAIDPKRN